MKSYNFLIWSRLRVWVGVSSSKFGKVRVRVVVRVESAFDDPDISTSSVKPMLVLWHCCWSICYIVIILLYISGKNAFVLFLANQGGSTPSLSTLSNRSVSINRYPVEGDDVSHDVTMGTLRHQPVCSPPDKHVTTRVQALKSRRRPDSKGRHCAVSLGALLTGWSHEQALAILTVYWCVEPVDWALPMCSCYGLALVHIQWRGVGV